MPQEKKKMTLEQKLESLKDKREGEEFFLIWNGSWCAGYMTTDGIAAEMNISVEVMGNTIGEALELLAKELR